ncbi:TetR/AcrR family transcriptional regulator [Microbacterium sp. SS28]|uniref:TetR/AcrR family transcriptional regulator n=1 Tax=Microbacterium sp. SS28 TaxID=2919948 RepID=UPI001FA98818|nr:TetR/AcrR family transcriptional regulator [Microbacterium sp. SS28]
MAARGPYAKGVAKRAEILETALDVIAQNGYSGATVKELADAVGLSQNGLLHYFGSKDALFLEILRFHSDIVNVEVDPEHTDFTAGLLARILAALSDSLEETGRSRLMLSVTMEATSEDHIAHDFIRYRYESFREVASAALTEMQTRGEFPADADPVAAAAVIASAFDGFVIQWMYDRSLDVVGQMAYMLDALGLRETETP